MSSMGEYNVTSFLCFFLVFVCLANTGSSVSCIGAPDGVEIKQVPTGRQIKMKTEWNVNITNTCFCTLFNLKLLCPGYGSLVSVNSSVISKIDNTYCLINNGEPLYGGTHVNFTYAFDRVEFKTFDYAIACS